MYALFFSSAVIRLITCSTDHKYRNEQIISWDGWLLNWCDIQKKNGSGSSIFFSEVTHTLNIVQMHTQIQNKQIIQIYNIIHVFVSNERKKTNPGCFDWWTKTNKIAKTFYFYSFGKCVLKIFRKTRDRILYFCELKSRRWFVLCGMRGEWMKRLRMTFTVQSIQRSNRSN